MINRRVVLRPQTDFTIIDITMAYYKYLEAYSIPF